MTAPAAPIAADPLVVRLRADHAANTGGGLALIAGGAVAAVVFTFVVTLLFWLWFGLPGLGFKGWWLLWIVIYAGAGALWLTKRPGLQATRAFAYVDPKAEWADPGSYDGVAGVVFVTLDWLFIAPRMVQAGVRQAKDQEPATRERFFDRCALLLRQLVNAGEAVQTQSVQIGDDETPDKLRPVLNYLDRAGWLGMSSDRSRLWLSSRAKGDLVTMGLIVPVRPE